MPSTRSGSAVPGRPGPVWLDNTADRSPALTDDLNVDALIVGAGLAGALMAAELSARSFRVAIVERGAAAQGTTGHSTAKITVLHGTNWSTIVERRGASEAMSQWAAMNMEAPGIIGDLVRDRGIECGFREVDAYLTESRRSNDGQLARESLALSALDLPAEKAVAIADSPFGEVLGVCVARQAQFDPAAFTRGLLSSLPARVSLFESSPVRRLSHEGGAWLATTDGGSVRSPIVVMTSLAPAYDPALLFTRMFPHAEHALEVSAPPRSVADGMWMQTDGARLTARPSDLPEQTWILGGEHIRFASEADERSVFARFIRAAMDAGFGGTEVIRHWSAEDFSTPDGLPFIGRVGRSDGLYLVGGFNGWGMSKSAAAARLVAGEIEGTGSGALRDLLSPNRFPSIASLPEFMRENGTAARHLLLPTREQKGRPRCTHMGCRTKLNTVEETLDCPCHGSRFGGDGSVITGPARRDITSS